MKWWVMILWVTQLGLSAAIPLCVFLLIGMWLSNTYELGSWILLICAVLGLATGISAARSGYNAMRKEAEQICQKKEDIPNRNEHD